MIEETEQDVRAAMVTALTKRLEGREPEITLVCDLIAATPWEGDRAAFMAAVSARLKELNAMIADIGGLHQETED